MNFEAKSKEICDGLGRVDFSEQAIPPFNTNKIYVGICRVILVVLVGIFSIVTFISACVCSAIHGPSLFCGLCTIILALIGLSWSILMLKRLFAEGSTMVARAESGPGPGIKIARKVTSAT
ncbi:hypothetical protein O1W69_05295 [Chlamydia sp. 12-01]|uniref:hypothetical protein n=1 Tax=Chlamydia sp. 12-01 TaxID=3002742 RepID=UPI0035D46C54